VPTYEYACAKCGRFEVSQRISDEALATCPTCGGSVKRLISGSAGILFKGDGFHTTDYRSKDYQKRAKEDTTPSEAKKTATETASKASQKA